MIRWKKFSIKYFYYVTDGVKASSLFQRFAFIPFHKYALSFSSKSDSATCSNKYWNLLKYIA